LIIRLNGEPYEIAGPLLVIDLLGTLGIDPRRVAVEHNLMVVKRDAYDSTIVTHGDEVEVVNFVGGGGRLQPWPTADRGSTACFDG
jgi:thiamine biosynthesis protein ThiS